VKASVDMAALGHLLGSPTRAAMLDALFDGRAWPVHELAAVAKVSPSTASEHLQLLRNGGLVVASREGRTHLYRLRGADVAAALELLGTLAPASQDSGLSASVRNDALHEARTCYDHLAGRLGVAITDALVGGGLVLGADDDLRTTAEGERRFAAIGVDIAALRRARRPLTRACLDWSERRPHLAGALGAALLARLRDVNGLERLPAPRAVRLLPAGRSLLDELGIAVTL
jgi:DNA-binding transcriptional ArsR family regulator